MNWKQRYKAEMDALSLDEKTKRRMTQTLYSATQEGSGPQYTARFFRLRRWAPVGTAALAAALLLVVLLGLPPGRGAVALPSPSVSSVGTFVSASSGTATTASSGDTGLPTSAVITATGPTTAPSAAKPSTGVTGTSSGASKTHSQPTASPGDRVVINEAVWVTSQSVAPDPGSRREAWTFPQFCALIGFDPTPGYIPDGLTPGWGNGEHDLYFFADGRPARLCTWTLAYFDADDIFSPYAGVFIRPAGVRRDSYLKYIVTAREESCIGGVTMMIGCAQVHGKTIYQAEFTYRGANFEVRTERLPEETFLRFLRSVVRA